jgi:hypothetical protein
MALPILTNTFKFLEKENYNAASFTELKELYNVIREFVMGSCYAILINEEIIYNEYDKTIKSAREIILDEMVRQQFANTPELLIQPNNNLDIKIYMFSTECWYMHIIYESGFFKLFFYN